MKEHKLMKLLDQAKPDLFPLNTHYMAQFSEHEKQQYATMLAAFITGSGFVSEAQTRLFSMLCVSLGLGKDIGQYYQQANNMNVEFLLNYINTIKNDENRSSAFLIDITMLGILGGACNNNIIINEFYHLLDVDFSDVSSCVSVILGNGITENCKFQRYVSVEDLAERVVKDKGLKEVKKHCERRSVEVKTFLKERKSKLKVSNCNWTRKFDGKFHKIYHSNIKFSLNFEDKSGFRTYSNANYSSNTKHAFECLVPIYIRMPDYFSAWMLFTTR